MAASNIGISEKFWFKYDHISGPFENFGYNLNTGRSSSSLSLLSLRVNCEYIYAKFPLIESIEDIRVRGTLTQQLLAYS